jgi:predicted RNase H-like HicB family nuclease
MMQVENEVGCPGATRDQVPEAKAAFNAPVPMFVTVDLGEKIGDYSSGGALPIKLSVWQQGAPGIDIVAPDIYHLRLLAAGRYTAGMKFRVVLEYDPEAESFSAVCPELPGCTSAGETEAEARQGIEEAIQLYLSPAEIELSPNAKLVEVTVGVTAERRA